ncbi:hypothetical protein P4O66_001239 [Electrophorus voltai]|uniref:Uncharacterized protein n=1 Tax=Electrophorus voltai TaxID=2609070 RepID=A0AAD9DWN2_9TELE|nr:hypothetical protein P4O66_001239 [Electrophorus voltai]
MLDIRHRILRMFTSAETQDEFTWRVTRTVLHLTVRFPIHTDAAKRTGFSSALERGSFCHTTFLCAGFLGTFISIWELLDPFAFCCRQTYASERFGQVEKGNTTPTTYTMNCRAEKIHQLRQELRTLKKQCNKSDKEKQALAELQNFLRKKLMTLCRADWNRRRGRDRARKRATFIANPFGFVKYLLGGKHSGHLECSREEVNCFLQKTLSDLLREQELESNKTLISPAPPTTEFKLREPSLKEVEEVIKRGRSASTLAPVVYPTWYPTLSGTYGGF